MKKTNSVGTIKGQFNIILCKLWTHYEIEHYFNSNRNQFYLPNYQQSNIVFTCAILCAYKLRFYRRSFRNHNSLIVMKWLCSFFFIKYEFCFCAKSLPLSSTYGVFVEFVTRLQKRTLVSDLHSIVLFLVFIY